MRIINALVANYKEIETAFAQKRDNVCNTAAPKFDNGFSFR